MKMAHSYNVEFVKVWPSSAQKSVTIITHKRLYLLYQSYCDHPDKLKNLLSEIWNTAVLESVATITVAGKIWFNCYIQGLNIEQKWKIQHHVGANIY